MVAFPSDEKFVVDDEVELPLQHHVEEGGETGLSDPLPDVE